MSFVQSSSLQCRHGDDDGRIRKRRSRRNGDRNKTNCPSFHWKMKAKRRMKIFSCSASLSCCPDLYYRNLNGVVVGVGGLCIDYIASVDQFPARDAKIRSTSLRVTHGGNVGNAITAAARLGSPTRICSSVAHDDIGKQIVQQLADEGVDVGSTSFSFDDNNDNDDDTTSSGRAVSSQFIIVDDSIGVSSPFTYIIADRDTGSRTCIHTPGPKLTRQHVTAVPTNNNDDDDDDRDNSSKRKRRRSTCNSIDIDSLLRDASIVFFDGRHTEGAIEIARRAKRESENVHHHDKKRIVVVEAESVREHLDTLLQFADGVICSKHFPIDWTREGTLGTALDAMFDRLPHVQWILTTVGEKGSILVLRHVANCTSIESMPDTLQTSSIEHEMEEMINTSECSSPKASRTMYDELDIDGLSTKSNSSRCIIDAGFVRVCAPFKSKSRVLAARSDRECDRNSQNCDKQKEEGEEEEEEEEATNETSIDGMEIRSIIYASSASIESMNANINAEGQPMLSVATCNEENENLIVDSTGAGDAYIGAFLASVNRGIELDTAMSIASVVAAANCTELGARSGIPIHMSQCSKKMQDLLLC